MNKAILIHETKGCVEEIHLDISPTKNQIFLLLGGPQTFIGQWPDIDVVILKAENASTKNENELPHPFNNEINTISTHRFCHDPPNILQPHGMLFVFTIETPDKVRHYRLLWLLFYK